MARSETLDLIIRVKNTGLSGLKTTRAGFEQLRSTVFNLRTALTGVATGAVVRSLYNAGAEAQRLDRVFEAITGSTAAAAEELAFVREEADRLGQEFYTVASSYKGLLASSQDLEISQTQIRELFVATLESATALGMTIPETEGSLRAFVQMLSKGNVQAEELRGQLGERMYGAFNLAAKSMNVSTQELNGMLERGEVLASDLLPRMAQAMHEKYGQAALDASQDAQQGLNRFTTAWKDLRVQVAKGGFLEAAAEGLKAITEALKDPEALQSMTQVGKGLGDIGKSLATLNTSALPGLANSLSRLLATWEKIPPDLIYMLIGVWVGKSFGAPGAVAGAVAGAIAGASKRVGQLREELETANFELESGVPLAERIEAAFNGDEIERTTRRIEDLRKKIAQTQEDQAGWRGFLMGDAYAEQIDRYEAEILSLEERLADLRKPAQQPEPLFWEEPPAPGTPEAETPELFTGKPTGTGTGGADDAPEISQEAQYESRLARLRAANETALAQLDAMYQQAEVSMEAYFAKRREEIEQQYAAEIALLQEMAEAEDDPDERLEIEDEIYKLRQEQERELIDLTLERARAQELADDARQKQLDAATKQAEELADIELAAQEKILEARKERAEEEERLNEQRLANTAAVAGGMSDIFQNLYELTGESNKDLFALARAAAIAQAVMNTAQAVTKAWAEGGPYAGPALAAVAAAAGAVQIATISAQSLATGGLVLGSSPTPTADNIPINATAGEFMLPVRSVAYYGMPLMEALRSMSLPREMFSGGHLPARRPPSSYHLASGGVVPAAAPASEKAGDTHYYIQAVDARSFMDLCKRSPAAIAAGIQRSAGGNGMARRTIKGVR